MLNYGKFITQQEWEVIPFMGGKKLRSVNPKSGVRYIVEIIPTVVGNRIIIRLLIFANSNIGGTIKDEMRDIVLGLRDSVEVLEFYTKLAIPPKVDLFDL